MPRSETSQGSGGPDVPRLALSIEEACAALGISWDLWRAHVADQVPIVRLGRRRLVSITELQRFLDQHGERVLGGAS